MSVDNSHFPGGRKGRAWPGAHYYTDSNTGSQVEIQIGDVYVNSDGTTYQWMNKAIGQYGPSVYYQRTWIELDADQVKALDNPNIIINRQENEKQWSDGQIEISVGPLGGGKGGQFDKGSAYRWPLDMIDEETDWVLFQFGKYPKPFGQDARNFTNIDGKIKLNEQAGKNMAHLSSYNNSAAALKPNGPAVMLPVPQDVANEIQQVWQGKQFSALGRAAISAAAAGNFANAGSVLGDLSGNLTALQASFTKLALNTIPGVGGNIEFNDIAGSTRGIVVNPNAELLYDSPQMREVGMVFKMVASNQKESEHIFKLCQTFRKNASPQYGGTDIGDEGSEEWKLTQNTILGGEEDDTAWGNVGNFIRVPNLCKFTFMKGHNVHPWLVQFKPCAISNVEVNYTPDGTYATHPDGAPVSVELRLSFMETKVVFSQEIKDEIGRGTF